MSNPRQDRAAKHLQSWLEYKPDLDITEQERADYDRRDHDHAPGAALPEASCTGGGCWFLIHLTS